MPFEDLFKDSVIKGMVFSAFDKFGPQPVYRFPLELEEDEYEQLDDPSFVFIYRDYMQIAVKSLSLLIGDAAYS